MSLTPMRERKGREERGERGVSSLNGSQNLLIIIFLRLVSSSLRVDLRAHCKLNGTKPQRLYCKSESPLIDSLRQ